MLRSLVASVFLFAAAACSAQIVSPSTISVAGDAEIRVVPDEVVLNMGIETVDRSLRTAKSANDIAIQHALEVSPAPWHPIEERADGFHLDRAALSAG